MFSPLLPKIAAVQSLRDALDIETLRRMTQDCANFRGKDKS